MFYSGGRCCSVYYRGVPLDLPTFMFSSCKLFQLSMNATSLASGVGGGNAALFGPLSARKSDDTASSIFEAPKLFQDTPSLSMTQESASKTIFSPPAAIGGGDKMGPITTGASDVAAQDGSSSSELTQEELEAFRAPEFVLGKIPEHAPPPELC